MFDNAGVRLHTLSNIGNGVLSAKEHNILFLNLNKNNYLCQKLLLMDNKTIIDTIAQSTGRSKENISDLMDALIDVLTSALKDGDSVSVPVLGTFETKLKGERITIHPTNGKKLMIPPKITINFKPSTTLKNRIRE